jgi:hypothetical protein
MFAETDVLKRLKNNWWKPDGAPCVDEKPPDYLGVANVGGVFLVLVGGCVLALVVAIFEFLWNVEKIAKKEKVEKLFKSALQSPLTCHNITDLFMGGSQIGDYIRFKDLDRHKASSLQIH